MNRSTRNLLFSLGLAAPVVVFGFSNGPPPRRTGAAVDGGLDCTACHRTFAPANSDPRGSVRIQTSGYHPGQKQMIRVTVSHPEAARWGFQLTARVASDETKMAGTLTPKPSETRVVCDNGQLAPCNGTLEFATHLQTATSAGTRDGHTFEVEWTPPETDVGDVVFYAAGNAANSGNTNADDRIYTTSTRISNCSGTARPTITSVVNAGSFLTGFSGNSLVTISGTNFVSAGASRLAAAGDIVASKFPTELSCVGVEIAGRRVPVTFIGDVGGGRQQINVQAPTLTSVGPVEVRVVAQGATGELRSDAFNATVATHSPAFFPFRNTSGAATSIAARHADFSILADPTVVTGATPARPGEVVLLYGTGFGYTEPVFQSGEVTFGQAPLRDQVTVTIGNVTLAAADVQYAGLTPESISGLYQFNVRIPDSVADGNVPVTIRVGGVSTPSAGAVIPVARR